jgi:hypothetical protein
MTCLHQDINMAITDKLADMVEIPLPDSMLQEQGRQNYSVRMLQLLVGAQYPRTLQNSLSIICTLVYLGVLD